jgi:LacI family transcriptional regulator
MTVGNLKMKPTTIRDVAKKAGVGLGTVSRVINDSPQVSPATRQRVLDVIVELNFTPNPTARHLSLGKTHTIAVIVPFFTRPSTIERLRGIEHSLAESDYDLVIYNVETVQRRDACFREIPRRERVDGVIIISLSPLDQDIPRLLNSILPIILVDANHPYLTSFGRVITDDVEGGRQATQYLIDLGHNRIGYISDFLENPFNFTSSRLRYQGYRQVLHTTGTSFNPLYHLENEHGLNEAYADARQMLSLPERPTAIFAASDTQAMGVLKAAKDLDLAVPDDLSVIGYDDIEVAEYLGLTTIRQLLYKSGQRGIEILLDILDGSSAEPACEVLPTELVIRQTTAPPR